MSSVGLWVDLCMATFLVLGQLPGLTWDQHVAARQVSTSGRIVRHLGCFHTWQGTGHCIIRAESFADVAAMNERAGMPFTEVLAAIERRPRGGSISDGARHCLAAATGPHDVPGGRGACSVQAKTCDRVRIEEGAGSRYDRTCSNPARRSDTRQWRLPGCCERDPAERKDSA
jgi:hypothetical protein